MNYGDLTANIVAADADKPVTLGVESEAILINISDVDQTLTTIVGGVITNLVLKAGKKAYSFDTLNHGLDFDDKLKKGKYRKMFTPSTILRVFDKTQDIKSRIMEISKGIFIVILKNKSFDTVGATKYEAYGFYSGLELNDYVSNSTDADGVVFSLTLGTNDNAPEPSLPLSVFKTDITTTESMIKALIYTAG